MVYQPAKDSYFLKKYILKYSKNKVVLDMGTGSGILAEEAVKNAKKVVAADIDNEAIEFCKEKFENKDNVKVIISNLFSSLNNQKFDLIIFNPPYLPEDKYDKGKDTTGGKIGNEIIEEFLANAKEHLRKNGKILLLYSSLSGSVIPLFEKYELKYKKLEEKMMFFEKLYVYLLKS